MKHVLGIVVILLAGCGTSTVSAARHADTTTCNYVADGGSLLARVTVTAPHCRTVNVNTVGAVSTYDWAPIETPSQDPANYPIVATETAVACAVHSHGAVITVYNAPDATGGWGAYVCRALQGVPSWAQS